MSAIYRIANGIPKNDAARFAIADRARDSFRATSKSKLDLLLPPRMSGLIAVATAIREPL